MRGDDFTSPHREGAREEGVCRTNRRDKEKGERGKKGNFIHKRARPFSSSLTLASALGVRPYLGRAAPCRSRDSSQAAAVGFGRQEFSKYLRHIPARRRMTGRGGDCDLKAPEEEGERAMGCRGVMATKKRLFRSRLLCIVEGRKRRCRRREWEGVTESPSFSQITPCKSWCVSSGTQTVCVSLITFPSRLHAHASLFGSASEGSDVRLQLASLPQQKVRS